MVWYEFETKQKNNKINVGFLEQFHQRTVHT